MPPLLGHKEATILLDAILAIRTSVETGSDGGGAEGGREFALRLSARLIREAPALSPGSFAAGAAALDGSGAPLSALAAVAAQLQLESGIGI